MTDISEKLSTILRFHVEPGEYKVAFDKMDKMGLPDRKQVNAILMTILETLDERKTNP